MKHRVIGIDLGTTYSAVAVWDTDQEQAVIIRDESGNATTPSVAAWDPRSRLVSVGEVAKHERGNHFCIDRSLRHTFDDLPEKVRHIGQLLRHEMNNVSFHVGMDRADMSSGSALGIFDRSREGVLQRIGIRLLFQILFEITA